LDGNEIVLAKCYAIYNTTLLNNFLGTRAITAGRHKDSPETFKKMKWRDDENPQREWVNECYQNMVKKYPWNSDLDLPIIPVVHGTDESIGWKICSGGFAALSSLDEGFYGKGIYFTSSCMYAIPYFATKPKPAILICFVSPGNTRPIIEHYNEEQSFLGVPIDTGYQSHYILTNKEGTPCKKKLEHYYDELVIGAEGQIIPIFLVTIDNKNLGSVLQKFQRVTSENKNTEDGKMLSRRGEKNEDGKKSSRRGEKNSEDGKKSSRRGEKNSEDGKKSSRRGEIKNTDLELEKVEEE